MYDFKTGESRSDNFIDDSDKFNYYDYLCQVTLYNLNGLAEKNIINLEIEDYTDPLEKFILHTAFIESNLTGHIYRLKMPFWDYIEVIFKEFGKKGFKVFKRYKEGKVSNATEILIYEAEANDIDPFIFSDIYKEYYLRKKV